MPIASSDEWVFTSGRQRPDPKLPKRARRPDKAKPAQAIAPSAPAKTSLLKKEFSFKRKPASVAESSDPQPLPMRPDGSPRVPAPVGQAADAEPELLAQPDEAPLAPLDDATGHDVDFFAAPAAGRRPRRLIAGLVAALLVMGGAGFFVLRSPESAEAVTFRYAFEPGEKRTYNVSMSMNVVPKDLPDAKPFDGKLSATMGYEVVDMREDGSATIEIALSNVSFEPNPTGTPFEGGSMRIRMAPDGRVAKVEGGGGLFGAAGASMDSFLTSSGGASGDATGSQFLFPQFPGHAIRPDDSWEESTKVPMPFGDQEIAVNTKARLEGYEDSSFGRVARMHHTISSPLDVEFTVAEMIKGLEEMAGQSLPPPPVDVQAAKFAISGDSTFDADSLVLPDTSEAVKLDGTAKMSMRMAVSGVPNAPDAFSFDATMQVSIVRVDVPTTSA